MAASSPDLDLAPLYRIDGKTDLGEYIVEWPGYPGKNPSAWATRPRRTSRYDVFGEMVLALTPLFLDARFRDQVSEKAL